MATDEEIPILMPATRADLSAIISLLSANDLPVQDVGQHVGSFILAKWRGVVVGTAGLEYYGEVALVRSLCVSLAHRGNDVGRQLLSTVEESAFARRACRLYLLTNAAIAYFERRGYAVLARNDAPSAIRNTVEFRLLCPGSATCMHKTLD